MKLTLAYSPCPNDTFIFYKMFKDQSYDIHLHDVEKLNTLLENSKYDISKASFYKWLSLRDKYELLNVGSALGNGCGPILISKSNKTLNENSKIAVPGRNTTAYLLFQLCYGNLGEKKFMTYDKVIDSLVNDEVDFAIIIHESRFVYQSFNLVEINDLGRWWEEETKLPIPLGCIVANKNLGKEVISQIEHEILNSLSYAYENRNEVINYVKIHAQELDENVMNNHIKTYVNSYTKNLGVKGKRSIDVLLKKAIEQGIVQ